MPQVVPFVVGAFQASAIGAATLWQTLTVWGIRAAVSVGLSYVAAKKSASRYDSISSIQGRMQNIRSTAQPRVTLYGKLRVGGQLAFVEHTGDDNEFLWLVLVHASHEVTGIDKYYINGEEVPMTGNAASSGSRFNGYFWAYPHLGTDDQVADANLVAASDGKWTSAHRLRGCAYTVFKLKWSNEENVWPNGIPVLTAEIRGKKVWDFRADTTGYTANWALCVADYVKENRGADNSDFALSEISAAANLCDESVGLNPSGSESRYELHAAIRADEDPEEVIDKMRAAAMGFISETGGFWTIHAGGWRAPDVTLVADDFHGPISVTTRQSIAEGGNGVRGVFSNGAEKYVPMEFPAVVNAGYLSEDAGIRRWIDLNLEYTTSSAMAQRLAKIALEEARQQISLSATLSNRGLRLRAGDVVNVTLGKFGWTYKTFEVHALEPVEAGDSDSPALLVEISLRETASGVYDWSDGEETAVDLAPNTSLRNAWEVPAPVWTNLESGTDQLIVKADGTIVSRIYAEWSFAGDASVSHFEIEYRSWTAEESLKGWQPLAVVAGDQRQVYLSNVYDGYDYEFRIRAINSLSRSAWVVSDEESVVGKSEPPAEPTSLVKADYTTPDLTVLSWTNPADVDLRGVEIWRRLGVNTFSEGSCVKIGEEIGERFVVGDDTILPSGIRYYFARAIDTSGNTSDAVPFYVSGGA